VQYHHGVATAWYHHGGTVPPEPPGRADRQLFIICDGRVELRGKKSRSFSRASLYIQLDRLQMMIGPFDRRAVAESARRHAKLLL
jgi:hypothetical protein